MKEIKLGLAEYILKRRLRGFSRPREIKNLEDCHSILIISNGKEDREADECSRLIRYFKNKNKEVFSIMYIDKSTDDKVEEISGIQTFSKDHLNWFFMPKKPEILDLMNREFDLLIDLSLQENFSLKYIHALSRAKLKVGAALNYKITHADLTIEMESEPQIPYLITQLKHYLTIINQSNHVAEF